MSAKRSQVPQNHLFFAVHTHRKPKLIIDSLIILSGEHVAEMLDAGIMDYGNLVPIAVFGNHISHNFGIASSFSCHFDEMLRFGILISQTVS